jgi:hypothetical protein
MGTITATATHLESQRVLAATGLQQILKGQNGSGGPMCGCFCRTVSCRQHPPTFKQIFISIYLSWYWHVSWWAEYRYKIRTAPARVLVQVFTFALHLQVAMGNLILKYRNTKDIIQDILLRRVSTCESWINDGLWWPGHAKEYRMWRGFENVPRPEIRNGLKISMSQPNEKEKNMR